MALEQSRFFDYTEEKPNEYQADEFSEYFRTFLTSGVPVMGTNLQVTAPDTGMLVNLNYGTALVHGGGYFLKDDGNGIKTLDIAAAHASYTRIDRVVLRRDISIAVSNIIAVIKPGTPSATPQPPVLTREGNVYEISLAQVRVEPGVLSIAADKVTDEREDSDVCGYVENLSVREQIAAIYTALSTGLAGKADSSHNQAMSTILGLVDALAGKAPTNHGQAMETIYGLVEALAGKLSAGAGAVGTNNIAAASVTADKVQGYQSNGQTYVPFVAAGNGPLEIGKFIDFHAFGSTADYDARIEWSGDNKFRLIVPGCEVVQLTPSVFGTTDTPPAGTYPAGTVYFQFEE